MDSRRWTNDQYQTQDGFGIALHDFHRGVRTGSRTVELSGSVLTRTRLHVRIHKRILAGNSWAGPKRFR